MTQKIFPVLNAVQISPFAAKSAQGNRCSRIIIANDLFNTFESVDGHSEFFDNISGYYCNLIKDEGTTAKHDSAPAIQCKGAKDADNFVPKTVYEANGWRFYCLFKLTGNSIKYAGAPTYYAGVLRSPEGVYSEFAGDSSEYKNIVFGKAVRLAESRKNTAAQRGAKFVKASNGKPTTTRQAVERAHNYADSLIQDIDALEARLRKLNALTNLDNLRALAIVGARRHNAHLLALSHRQQRKTEEEQTANKAAVILNELSPEVLAALRRQLGL